MKERNRVWADPNATDDDYTKVMRSKACSPNTPAMMPRCTRGTILTDPDVQESRSKGPIREAPRYATYFQPNERSAVSAPFQLAATSSVAER
jgi:hypothetical protein